MSQKIVPLRDEQAQSWLTEYEQYLFSEGTFYQSYEKLGAHIVPGGVWFSLWAPNAERVSVLGDFNNWQDGENLLRPVESTGIWSGFVANAKEGQAYKFQINSRHNGYTVQKSDPYGFYAEVAPKSASVICRVDNYKWNDENWMKSRAAKHQTNAPISIYEMHLGSWKRSPEDAGRVLSYRELAETLPAYVADRGFTHVELLPITEHPFDGSWGYQVIGFFAPTSRFGTPQDFMYLVDSLHQAGIGVLLDWVPAHFPADEHGLAYFDGTHLYEHEDRRQGFHPDWQTYIFNFSRNEVRNFLISSALFWMEKYHLDGLRVDAVASMLYLDYSREEGEWIPNEHGGRENLAAISFLKQLNEVVYEKFPDTMTVAEESTSWPMVSRPTYIGGLGFGYKWNMGWMNDVLSYFTKDPIYRQHHHNNLTFGLLYAFHENFVLPLSHDEVVHGKGSLIGKMPGDDWQRFANLRLLYGFMFGHPGKKLLFMGSEFAQFEEWRHDKSIDWHLLDHVSHRGVFNWLTDLNKVYKEYRSLHEVDFDPRGFRWIDCNDTSQSILSFARFSEDQRQSSMILCNFTPVPRYNYRVGVPAAGYWEEVLNSDSDIYWGSGIGNLGGVISEQVESHGLQHSIVVTIPPLSALIFSHGE